MIAHLTTGGTSEQSGVPAFLNLTHLRGNSVSLSFSSSVYLLTSLLTCYHVTHAFLSHHSDARLNAQFPYLEVHCVKDRNLEFTA